MKVLGIRLCNVSSEAEAFAKSMDQLGMVRKELDETSKSDFQGAIFPAGSSWLEVWPQCEELPAGVMIQIIVDDADAFATNAENSGLEIKGPVEAHGEKIYYFKAPGGMQVSFQSKISD